MLVTLDLAPKNIPFGPGHEPSTCRESMNETSQDGQRGLAKLTCVTTPRVTSPRRILLQKFRHASGAEENFRPQATRATRSLGSLRDIITFSLRPLQTDLQYSHGRHVVLNCDCLKSMRPARAWYNYAPAFITRYFMLHNSNSMGKVLLTESPVDKMHGSSKMTHLGGGQNRAECQPHPA